MKTHVEFTSKKFPSCDTEEEGVNFEAGIYGKKLAEFLQEKLPSKGIQVSTIFPEDWGWTIEIQHDSRYPLWIGYSPYNDTTDNGFLCFIEPSKPTIRRWFKKIDVRDDVARVAEALDEILHAENEINNIRWWNEDEVA